MKKQLLLTCFASVLGTVSFAQGFVTTGGQKNVLVEESTGAWCQFCPDGALKLQQLIEGNPRVVGVSIHGGSGSDAMKFPDGNAVTADYFTAFPLGMVDRVPYGSPPVVALSRSSWSPAATAQASVVPEFDVSLLHGYNSATREITAKVDIKALKAGVGAYTVNVYVVEDSVTGTGSGYNQVNAYNTQSGHPYFGKGNPIVGYVHMHVVRAMLGGSIGSTGVVATNPAKNSISSKTYTYVLPAGANYNRFKLVAMVQKASSDPFMRAVMNTVKAKVINAKLDVNSIVALDDVATFPNPANNSLRVTGSFHTASDLNLTLSNSLGQTVLTRTVGYKGSSTCDETLDVSGLSEGIYFLNIRSEAGQNSVRVMVRH